MSHKQAKRARRIAGSAESRREQRREEFKEAKAKIASAVREEPGTSHRSRASLAAMVAVAMQLYNRR